MNLTPDMVWHAMHRADCQLHLQAQIIVDVLGQARQLISGLAEVVQIRFTILPNIAESKFEQEVPPLSITITVTHD